MPQHHSRKAGLWIAGAVLALVCGCADYLPFMHKPADDHGTTAPEKLTPQPQPGPKPLQQLSGPMSNNLTGEGANERVADMSQRLAAAEDDRRALLARIQQLELAIEERDRALASARKEIMAANEEVTRTRSDLQRWKQEVAATRDRLHGTEKENLATLQSIVSTLEQFLEREKAADGKKEPAGSKP